MATLTIEVPDEYGEALAACDFLSLDKTASAELLHEAVYDLVRSLDDVAAEARRIYDSAERSAVPELIGALALRVEGMDPARRMRRLADGLGSLQ